MAEAEAEAKEGTGPAEPCCISHAFDRAARRNPDRLAVIHSPASDGDGEERRFTCGDLLAAVASLSRRIAAAVGVTPTGPLERPGASSAVPALLFLLLARSPHVAISCPELILTN
jgi:acyl-CoA synthetase